MEHSHNEKTYTIYTTTSQKKPYRKDKPQSGITFYYRRGVCDHFGNSAYGCCIDHIFYKYYHFYRYYGCWAIPCKLLYFDKIFKER